MLRRGTAATQSVASAAGTHRTHPNTHHQPPNVPCSVHASSVAPTQLQVQLESLRSVVQLTIVVEIVYFISLISQGRGCVRLLTFTHSTWPLSAAAYAGVQPSLASVFTSPPASSNTFTLESEGLEPGGGDRCVGQILGSSAALTTGPASDSLVTTCVPTTEIHWCDEVQMYHVWEWRRRCMCSCVCTPCVVRVACAYTATFVRGGRGTRAKLGE